MNTDLPLSIWNAGWLSNIKHCHSPNCDDRPENEDVDLLVIHNISLPPDQYGSDCVESFFCNTLDTSAHPYFEQLKGLEVSSHFLIKRDGELVQFVATDKRAWHAGESRFEQRSRCNDFSIGIELEGSDTVAYEEAQYQQLAKLAAQLIAYFPSLTSQNITGHSDIAPARKTDPGPAFDWDKFHNGLQEILASSVFNDQ